MLIAFPFPYRFKLRGHTGGRRHPLRMSPLPHIALHPNVLAAVAVWRHVTPGRDYWPLASFASRSSASASALSCFFCIFSERRMAASILASMSVTPTTIRPA